jgi:uncharacterized repeat protein (TIGR03803 family)
MSRNKNLGRLSEAMLVAITVILVLAPGAWAQGTYKILHRFRQGTGDGLDPTAGLIFDQSGNLYGVTEFGGAADIGAVFALIRQADGSWKEDTLYSFLGGTDGLYPYGDLVFDEKGNLYGTTSLGGASDAGTVFKLAPNSDGTWTESVLYSFCSLANCTDGVSPIAGMIFDRAGNLYGTASGGGGGRFGNAGGVVFELAPNSDGTWTESVLHTFCSLANCSDGENPTAGLIFDESGNLYGTTPYGGSGCYGRGCGVVFKLAPNSGGGWTESVLYSFCPFNKCRVGSSPTTGLTFDQAGNLYGTTRSGGDLACGVGGGTTGCGVVFELTPNANGSWKEQVLHSFRSRNGAGPDSLRFGPAGDLYGSTVWGGDLNRCLYGCGVVFKLAPNSNGGWKGTVLHTFVDHPGATPVGVIFDATGNLYGTTYGDQVTTFGSVFEITQ